jgi:hypothetical protein
MSDVITLASVAPIAVASALPVATQIGQAVGGILAEHANEIAAIAGATVLVVADGLVERFLTPWPWARILWGMVRGKAGSAAEKATADSLRKLDGRHD